MRGEESLLFSSSFEDNDFILLLFVSYSSLKGQKNHTCVCMRARSSSRIKKREKYYAVDDERRALCVHRTRKKMHQNRSRKERETFLL
jgi:hypothetical protein